MAMSIVWIVGLVVAAAAWFGLKPSFGFRFLSTAARLPRHRANLRAMCPALPSIPPDVANALPIHMTTWGETGPKVLLIHGGVQGGLGGGPATFCNQRVLAESGWRVCVVDRPGFGQSPSRGPDDMEADAEWVTKRLDDGAHLIGHSFGGAVALLAAARRPAAVRSLTVIEPALIPLVIAGKALKTDADAREDLLRMIQSWLSARTPAEYARVLMRSLGVTRSGGGEGGLEIGAIDEQSDGEFGCAFLRARFASSGALRKAARIVAAAKIPVLVVTGGWSPTFEAVGRIAAELTGGRRVVVASPDHFVQMVAADEFNRTVDEFMRSVERTSGNT
jgi:pimeloyl-ACP methyl ester carboxylesterase